MSEHDGEHAPGDDAAPPRGAAPVPPPATPEPATPEPDWSQTSVLVPPPTAPVEPPPTLVPDAPTVVVPPRETTVDPLVPPAPPAPPAPAVAPPAPGWSAPPPAPGWSAPAAPPPAPGWSAPAAPGWSSPSSPPPVASGWSAAPGAPAAQGQPQPAYPQPLYGQPPAYGSAYPPPGLPGVAGWGAVPRAPKPGVIPLRPLGVGEILDGAISYVRRDPKTVLGISALVAAASALLQIVLYGALSRAFTPLLNLSTAPGGASSAEFDAAMRDLTGGLAGLAVALSVVGLVTYVLNVLATGLLTTAMGRAVLGKPVSTSDVWRRAAGRFWPLLGVTLLVSLILSASVVVGLGVAVLLGVLIGQASSGLGALVGVLLGLAVVVGSVWLYVKLLLSPVALVLEGVGPISAIRRSFALVAGAWWRTFGIHVLAVIIAGVVAQVIAVPFGIVGGVISASTAGSSGALDPFSFTQSLVTALSTLVSSTIVIPFSAGVVSLLYIDRRIRREALDLELARAAGIPGA